MKKFKRLRGFFSGVLIILLLVTSISAYGTEFMQQTISVVFNKVNIALDGTIIGEQGENYTLANGDQVPYSILYKGTTYVPIRKISEILGKDVGWINDTNTATITGGNSSNGAYTKEDIERLKLYSEISHNYKGINHLIDYILDTSNSLSFASEYILANDSSYLDQTENYINSTVEHYNDALKPTQDIILKANKYGIDISNMNTSLNKSSEAIGYYEEALNYLEKFSLSNSNDDFYNYLNNKKKAFDVLSPERYTISDGYFKFYDLIQGY